MIVFKNKGEIDVRSITSFGVSVKEGSNPIGFFGTGLKYAIAVLLRTGHAVTFFSGESVYRFALESSEVRGKDFDFVTIQKDGGKAESIGFTTELGKQWEVWMAYREIECNCKDEGGQSGYYDYTPDPEPGMTQIIVSGDEFSAVYAKRNLFILEDKAAFVSNDMEIRLRPSRDYFYRGIRVSQLPLGALFTYNDLSHIELTEDRTMKNQAYMKYNASKAVLRSTDERFIKQCVLGKDCFEETFDYHGWGIQPSEQFISVVGSLVTDRMLKVNPTALKVWQESTKKLVQPKEIELTKVQKMMVEKALDFVAKMGFPVRESYEISFVETMGDGILGLAHENKIFIAERVFHMGGTKQLASTLIEEYLHLRHGWEDMSREMQSFLFEKLVSVGEEMTGEPL